MLVERECDRCPVRALHCFANLQAEDVELLHSTKHGKSYKKGQVIYSEGLKPTGIFCLSEGKVKIFRLGNDGKEQIVRFAMPGDIFGLRALLGGSNYSTSATAIEDSEACIVPKPVFFKVIVKYPEISHYIMVMLSQMVDNAENKLLSIAQKPVRERLAETLIALHNMFNKNQHETSINLTRTDLANIVGTANETVIRLLTEFKEENLIYINGRKITIYDFEGLRKIAKVT
jgi:CRP-like cAMP-binding protein